MEGIVYWFDVSANSTARDGHNALEGEVVNFLKHIFIGFLHLTHIWYITELSPYQTYGSVWSKTKTNKKQMKSQLSS